MKNIVTTLIILISSLSFGQQYDKVFIENSKVDKNNKVYSLGKEFSFKFDIRENNSKYFIKNNDGDSIELTNDIASLVINEIRLTVLKPKIFQRTNKKQTEIIYSYEPNPKSLSFTGLVENEKNIWIHPPREGFFKSLETCPFPYIVLNKPVGFKWVDSMIIGNQWSNKIWGEWEDSLLLEYAYEIIGTEKINSNFGEIDCVVIEAMANSRLGKSKLKSYFNEKYGFVELHYTLANGIEIDLILNKIVKGPILRDGKEFYNHRYK
ncbi:hypothetical protein [Myroides guanonis]|uniref:Uncharacterized protein n=1 Tax=Myroides guanonis TaxID=1150112 RepID=A0A1I3U2G3_9FLAO|nr:hypothetical protein [Myroides guanonis]SFJ76729.1 hypothetical protein SAMN04487893_11585 [Myroides guanonis]